MIPEYTYNHKGYRIRKNSTEKGITDYLFDLSGNVVYTEGAGKTEWFIFAFGKHLAKVEQEDGETSTSTYYYLTDHLGTTVMMTDEDCNVVWQDDLSPFGESDGDVGILDEHAKYTSKDYDDETGLYYFNARWYDPSVGRFINVDPVKSGLHWYAYCSSNPLTRVDPTGLIWDNETIAEYASYLGASDEEIVEILESDPGYDVTADETDDDDDDDGTGSTIPTINWKDLQKSLYDDIDLLLSKRVVSRREAKMLKKNVDNNIDTAKKYLQELLDGSEPGHITSNLFTQWNDILVSLERC